MHAFLIDTFEFSRLKENREGETAVADFARLSEELAEPSGVVRWTVRGGVSGHGHPQLSVSVDTSVRLMCQRCLTPFAFDVATESTLLLVKDEAAADELESLLDDESIDVMVGTKAMNAYELIEDEVLLAIPLSPKHAVCPDQLGMGATDAAAEAKKVSPFAVLKNKQ